MILLQLQRWMDSFGPLRARRRATHTNVLRRLARQGKFRMSIGQGLVKRHVNGVRCLRSSRFANVFTIPRWSRPLLPMILDISASLLPFPDLLRFPIKTRISFKRIRVLEERGRSGAQSRVVAASFMSMSSKRRRGQIVGRPIPQALLSRTIGPRDTSDCNSHGVLLLSLLGVNGFTAARGQCRHHGLHRDGYQGYKDHASSTSAASVVSRAHSTSEERMIKLVEEQSVVGLA
jgi:hypothetical protein